MTTYVLVHGGLHGSWCWQRVVGPLRDAGHAVDAVDLPNVLLVEDGEAALPKLQTAGEECASLRPGAPVFSDDGSTVSVARDFVLDGFYNRCSVADAESVSAQLCAEPVARLMAPY